MQRSHLISSLLALAVATAAHAASTPPVAAEGASPESDTPSAAQAVRVKRLKDGMERKLKRKPKAERVAETTDWQAAWAQQRQVHALDRFDQPEQALTHFLAKRVSTGMSAIGPDSYAAGLQQAARMPVRGGNGRKTAKSVGISSAAIPGAWSPRGPGNIGGRTRAILIHPTTPNVMWAAGVAGGIWKSTDGGTSWAPKADLLVNIAVNSMVLDPRNPNIIYAGTGEGFFNSDAVRGAGVLKSTDGGETWTQLPATAGTPDFHYVQKLVMSKGSSQRLYAATRTGVFRTTDGGATWSKVHDAAAVNGCMDLAIQTDRALAQVFAACGTFTQATVYRALDTASATQNWAPVFSQAGMGRTSLAIAPSNQNIIYAMAANATTHALHGVYRSTSSGASGTWTTQTNGTSSTPTLNRQLLSNPVYAFLGECGFGASQQLTQGWYDNALAVDPANPDIVWAGGIDLFRSNDGGRNWGQASHWWFTEGADREYNHADQHTIVFHPGYNGTTNKIMYTGNDGGVHRTLDARAPVSFSPDPVTPSSPVCGSTAAGLLGWETLNNGYEVTQFYHGAVYPGGETYFGGTQDNGTLRGVSGNRVWESIRGGDGGYVAVNPADTNMLWVENTGRSIQRSTDGGVNYTAFTSGITEAAGNFLFITPFAQDPGNANRMLIGGARVWRTTAATAVPQPATVWTLASQFLSARVSALAVSPLNSDRLYAGTQAITGNAAVSGVVYTTASGTTATGSTVWSGSKPRPGVNYVSWIAPDPVAPNVVYATISTFNDATGSGHVFKSSDSGATWTNIDGSGATGLPDVPAHSIVIDPLNNQRLYVGTDIGVFSSVDGGANWARENSGFANVIVESLSIEGRRLYAFTHGRSVFSVDLP